MILFHGTNRRFAAFDPHAARADLNASRWVSGGRAVSCTFFSTDIGAAREYARSRRNSLIHRQDALDAVAARLGGHPRLAALFRDLVVEGHDTAWGRFLAGCPGGNMDADPDCIRAAEAGFDINDLNDLARHVQGSAAAEPEDRLKALNAILTNAGGGLPDWVLDVALSYGLDCRPRVVAGHVADADVLRTQDRRKMERALEDGCKAAWMPGDESTVRGAPEVAVADHSVLRIVGVSIGDFEHDCLADAAGLDGNLRHAALPIAAARDIDVAVANVDVSALVPAQELGAPPGPSLLVSFNDAGRLVRLREIGTGNCGDFTCRSTPLPCPDLRLAPAIALVPSR
jgi:hypothetical protein